MKRKGMFRLLTAALCALVFGFTGGGVFAQSYPSKPITFLCPFPPGAGNDVIARILAQKMSERLGQSVVVENRLGATGAIATEMTAKSPPDGYTIIIVSTSTAIYSSMAKVPYDLAKDFAYVALVGTLPYLLVVPTSLPAKSIGELVALAKSKPGQFNYASGGVGSIGHLMGEMLKKAGGVDIATIHYKGTPEALADVLAGRVQIWFTTMATALPQVKSGKLRALGVSGTKRASVLPDVPTMAEAGFPTLDCVVWFAILTPAATPKKIVNQLNSELVKILAMPEVQERLSNAGVEPSTSGTPPDEIFAYIKKDIERWNKVIEDSGIHLK